MINFKDKAPLLIGSIILIIITGILFFVCTNFTGGKFIYALDDAYIHLSYSKNLALHNIWGISRYEFSTATSSPIWTLLLTILFLTFGVHDLIPFVLNVIFSLILMYVVFNFLKQHSVSNFFIGAVLLSIIFFLPISIHIFSGMEHILQSILTILFLKYSAESLSKSEPNPRKFSISEKYLFLISLFITTIRYEGFFLVLLVSVLFFFRKRFLTSIVILTVSLLLPVIFGFVFIHNGGNFLPNSVLLKSNFSDSVSILFSGNFFENVFKYFNENKKIIFLSVLSVILFFLHFKLDQKFWSEIPLLLFMLISVILIQKLLMITAYFRYDAYLVVAAIAIDSLAVYDYCLKKFNLEINIGLIRKNKIALSIFFICIVYLVYKNFHLDKTVTAVRNIYEQQYQMAKFIGKFYSQKEVALNDIGTVNYFSDIYCLDLIGLTSNGIANQRLNKTFNSNSMSKIAKEKKVKIAIVYDDWFQKDITIPKEWIKTGQWKISDNYICGSDEISFYAVDESEKENLKKYLKLFSKELPSTVVQTGDYLSIK